MEAVQIAGFSEAEANKFFGNPNGALIDDLEIVLRPAPVVRADYTARYNALIQQL